VRPPCCFMLHKESFNNRCIFLENLLPYTVSEPSRLTSSPGHHVGGVDGRKLKRYSGLTFIPVSLKFETG
jgi:hypothetical protein